MVHQDPEGLPEGGTAKALGGLFEGFVRDAFVNGAVLLSLIVVVAGFLTKTAHWGVAGVVMGGAGIVLPWTAVGRKWVIPRVWITVIAVIGADVAALALMWTTT